MKDRNAHRRTARATAARARVAPGGSRAKGASGQPHRGRWVAVALVLGALAFAAGWNPPSDTGVHKFTEASDYSAKRETGCTNSGEGCHGEDERRIDFNRYHPETECKTCHEYTGVGCIPCHGPRQHECTGCHDGSMDGVSDTVRLTDPWPKGHYRESLHAAMGTDMKQVVRAAPGGKAKAACGDCHSRDLRKAHTKVRPVEGSEYGETIGCAECHNDKKSGALEQVKKDWKKHRCEDCHGEKSQAPMHAADVATALEAEDPAGCGTTGAGCHENTDLHAMHADEPVTCSGRADESEPGCHDLGVESHVPTMTACGSGDGTCHRDYRNDEYGHKNDASAHSPGNDAQRGAVWRDALTGVESTCGSCHSTDLGVEHNRAHSPIAGDACLGCHNKNETTVAAVKDSWPGRDSANACAACHGKRKHADVGTVHKATQYTDSGEARDTACVGSGCHPSADVRVLHAGLGCTFSGCHSASGDINGSNIMSCGGTAGMSETSCHAGGVHAEIDANHLATELDRNGDPAPGSCVRSGCHTTADVRTLHASTGDCATAGCHAGDGPTVMTCGGPSGSQTSCHGGTYSWHEGLITKHTGTEIGPSGTPRPGACTPSGCHKTVSLYDIHKTVGCNIAGCHDGLADPNVTGCGGPAGTPNACHTDLQDWHYAFADSHVGIEIGGNGEPAPGACTASRCHATVSLYTLHRDIGCNIPYCHGANSTARCGGPAGTPNACHTGDTFAGSWHADYASSHVGIELGSSGTPQPGACTGASCHATVSLYTLHTAVGCNLPGCHSANPIASCGGPAGTPNACHTPAPPSTCIIPAPQAPVEAVWRTPHTDGTTPALTRGPAATGEERSAIDRWTERAGRARRASTPPSEDGDTTDTPSAEGSGEPADPPASDKRPKPAPQPDPECTKEGSITIEASAICLECHDVSTKK
jgi:hypothetical protein